MAIIMMTSEITWKKMMPKWGGIYGANFLGEAAVKLACGKERTSLLYRGLCPGRGLYWMVCLAVWMALAPGDGGHQPGLMMQKNTV
jgi:formate/nitrite transporter FocA (FNT family)